MERAEKSIAYLNMMNQWMIMKFNQYDIGCYLLNHSYKKIALYGNTIYARHVIRELQGSEVSVECIVDRTYRGEICGIPVVALSENILTVDCVINTIIYDKDAIRTIVRKIGGVSLIELDDLIFSWAQEMWSGR